ncbi:MAG: MarR family winged helix-turn-helix transcriptional regulator [Candidatus Saccharimonadales bacterium]
MPFQNDLNLKIQQLANLLAKASDQVLQAQLSIGLAQFRILKTVQANDRLLQRHIALELNQSEASVSRQIKLLYDRQLLVTVLNPKDHRQRITILTPKGSQVLGAALLVLQSFQTPLVKSLSKQQLSELINILDQIEDRVK